MPAPTDTRHTIEEAMRIQAELQRRIKEEAERLRIEREKVEHQKSESEKGSTVPSG